MSYLPDIQVSFGNGAAAPAPGSAGALDIDLQQLESGLKPFLNNIGTHNLQIGAGDLSMASPAQIGRIVNGVPITAATVAANQQALNQFATWCRANNVSLTVEIQADNAPQADWTYQWLNPAVQAGLPIGAVENVNEDELSATPAQYGTIAGYKAAILQQIVAYYPAVKFGEWVAGAPQTALKVWQAYDQLAAAQHLPQVSFLVADTAWNTPWITSPGTWQSWMQNLSQVAQTNGLKLDVLVDGVQAAGSATQWTAQSEQHAAMVASLPGVQVDALRVESWNAGKPLNTLDIGSTSSIANDAIEIAATFPLYHNNLISAQDSMSLSAPAAITTIAGAAASVPLTLAMSAADIAAGASAAVVLADQTGTLDATLSGAGTVTHLGDNVLVLSGTKSDLATELASLTVTESGANADKLNVELFGAAGRVMTLDATIVSHVVASSGPARSAALPSTTTLSLDASNPYQGTSSATASLSLGQVTTLTQTWGTNAQLVTLHEPLAGPDVYLTNGSAHAPLANPATGSTASLPVGSTGASTAAFDPSNQVFSANVTQTTLSYSASGELESHTEVLAASNPVALVTGGSLSNYFATGGRQVTLYNTGDNQDWNATWDSALASVTTTYGSQNQVLEQVFQGGATETSFSLDNVYNPYSGALWEQYETSSPAAAFSGFVTGVKYVTLFNTGDNPDWNANAWGTSIPQVTITVQDYYTMAVQATAPVRTGQTLTDAYGPAAPSTLTEAAGQSGSLIAGHGTTSVTGNGRDMIHADTATRSIDTGAGNSTVYLPAATPTNVQIVSGGGDTIYAEAASVTVTNSASAEDTLVGTGTTVTVHGTTPLDISTDSRDCTIIATGTAVKDMGIDDTIVGAENVHAWLISANGALQAGDNAVVDLAGTGTHATTGNSATAWLWGDKAVLTTGNNSAVNFYAQNGTVTAGSGTQSLVSGTGNTLTTGSNSKVTVTGSGNTIVAGDDSIVTLTGGHNHLVANADATVFLGGDHEVVTANAWGGTQTIIGFDPTKGDMLDVTSLLKATSAAAQLPQAPDYSCHAYFNGSDTVVPVHTATGSATFVLKDINLDNFSSIIGSKQFMA